MSACHRTLGEKLSILLSPQDAVETAQASVILRLCAHQLVGLCPLSLSWRGGCCSGLWAPYLGVSNCPLCALGHESNAQRIYKLSEMDADHVTAWSKGGATDAANCQMLCKTHNRAKGNR